jgi:predicted small metal-binding protein|tara:strand:- start:169 stop:519 length:351 start_codon:yes stop_codon:yes gene_type:complete
LASVGQSLCLALLQYFMEVKNYIIMTKSISCKDAEKDCTWSASTESITELMSKVMIHVLTEHKEIELNPENIAIIKSQIKTKIFKDGVQVESGMFWWWGEKMEKVNKLIADENVRL